MTSGHEVTEETPRSGAAMVSESTEEGPLYLLFAAPDPVWDCSNRVGTGLGAVWPSFCGGPPLHPAPPGVRYGVMTRNDRAREEGEEGRCRRAQEWRDRQRGAVMCRGAQGRERGGGDAQSLPPTPQY